MVCANSWIAFVTSRLCSISFCRYSETVALLMVSSPSRTGKRSHRFCHLLRDDCAESLVLLDQLLDAVALLAALLRVEAQVSSELGAHHGQWHA
jgi:hypothetical protein